MGAAVSGAAGSLTCALRAPMRRPAGVVPVVLHLGGGVVLVFPPGNRLTVASKAHLQTDFCVKHASALRLSFSHVTGGFVAGELL